MSVIRIMLLCIVCGFVPKLLHAQVVGTEGKCRRAKPEPACRTFWVTEIGVFGPLAGTRVDSGSSRRHLEASLTGEFGIMRNRGTAARGVLLSLGTGSSGNRFAIVGRHRRWLNAGANLDLTGGLVGAQGRYVREAEETAYGLTGDIALGWRDAGAIVVRSDLLRGNGRTLNSLHAGVRVGSPATMVAALVGILGLAMLNQGGS